MGSYWFSSIGFKDRQHNIHTHTHTRYRAIVARALYFDWIPTCRSYFSIDFFIFFFSFSFFGFVFFYHFLFFLFLFVFSFCSRWTSGCNATWSWRHITHATRRPISTLRATCNPIAFVASIPVVESTIAVVSPWDFVYFKIVLIFFSGNLSDNL